MTLQDQINALAEALLEEASKENSELVTKEKVDIFKATSAWVLGSNKIKPPDEEDAAGTFEALRSKLNPNGAVQ